jgi:hypothetical protein
MKIGRAMVSLAAAAVFTLPAAAAAQDEPPEAPRREYVAPLSQQTQPSYVPQSVALSGPRLITDWEEGDPVPPGYHPSTRIRKGPVIAGAILFGVFYLFSTLVAAGGADSNPGGSNPEAALWVPGIGPFIQMPGTSTTTGTWLLAVDGLVQTAGLAMLVYGIASPRPVLVRNDLGVRFAPRPMALGRNGGGLGVVGSF